MKQGIVVTDSKSNIINVSLNLGNDNKSIILTNPNGYTAGEKYKLSISNSVHSLDGKNINQAITMNFSVKAADTQDKIVTFKNKYLETAIREALNKPTEDLLESDIKKITNLNLPREISDLSGIENLTNLQLLNLDGNFKITDLTPLENLTNLQTLYLDNCQSIKSLNPLKNLTNLKTLNLAVSNISDISALKNLTNLQDLNLAENQINNIDSLKNLINLETLNLSENKINDINALNQLTNLKTLNLDCNKVSDINALKGLSKLYRLGISTNPISNEDLQELKTRYPPAKFIKDKQLEVNFLLPHCRLVLVI